MENLNNRIHNALKNHNDPRVKEIVNQIDDLATLTFLLLPHFSENEKFDFRFLAPGKSGAWVLLAMVEGNMPRVIKYGKREVIEKERENYRKRVKGIMSSSLKSDLLESVGYFSDYGSIAYSWAGENADAISFRDYFIKPTPTKRLLKQLIQWLTPFSRDIDLKRGFSYRLVNGIGLQQKLILKIGLITGIEMKMTKKVC